MKVLLSWLKEFVDVDASGEEIGARLSLRGFALEGIEQLPDGDVVLDFDVTGNRPDCMNVVGLAREVAVAYGHSLNRRPQLTPGPASPDPGLHVGRARSAEGGPDGRARSAEAGPDGRARSAEGGPDGRARSAEGGPDGRTGSAEGGPDGRTGSAEGGPDGRAGSAEGGPAVTAHGITITIDNDDLCRCYAGGIADVTVGPSPAWMQARLKASGIRPISNIVDITNYVLLELGQPMHAFDLTKIGGAHIRVRTAKPGERLKTLDGQDRELSPDMLVIADAEKAIAVAGVMGGADSEVHDGTKTIVFESAYFNPLSVRRTARKLGMKTEASMRFERGADRMMPPVALMRALTLLEETGAGTRRGIVIAGHPEDLTLTTLRLRRARIQEFLGMAIPDADVFRILGSLGFTSEPSADGWNVTVPPYRIDVHREVDLLEELARHYGYDRIPSHFPALTAPPAAIDPRIVRARQLRAVMTGAGFSEAVTFGFIAASAAASFAAAGDVVAIANPLSETFGVLRPSALPGLLDAVAHNRRRQQADVRLFEVGNRFSRARGESRTLAAVWTGAADSPHWSGGNRDVDFFDIKGAAERVCDALGVSVRTAVVDEPWLAAGRSGALLAGPTRVGVIGQIAPAIVERHGIPVQDAIYALEIDLDAVAMLAEKPRLQVEPLPRFPSVTRDISILVADTLAAETVRQTIAAAAPETLASISEFDRYQGKGVPEGQVSLSLRLTFQSPTRTLTDAEVQAAMDAILAALRDRHGSVQR